jgi:predicted GIY-YIG superfamily endonuclease
MENSLEKEQKLLKKEQKLLKKEEKQLAKEEKQLDKEQKQLEKEQKQLEKYQNLLKKQVEKEKKLLEKEKKQLEIMMKKQEEKWSLYIILHPCGATYAGVSPDPVKRLRKHNGELAGGAKYTLSKGKGWQHICLVHGFQTKSQSLQFEWALKHVPPRNAGGIENRIKKLYTLLNKPFWTSKAPPSSTVPLEIEWKMNDQHLSYAIFYGAGIDRQVPLYVSDLDLHEKDQKNEPSLL